MNRRNALLASASLAAISRADAGVMDSYNGVKLGTSVPEYDAEYIDEVPPIDRKLLLIDFWATWCAPCREEFPHLNDLHAQFAGQGLVVVGLTQESTSIARAFLPKVSIKYHIGAGGTKPLQRTLGIKALPYAILVDQKGSISWRGQASRLTASETSQRLKSAA